jgi:hypothetical protein
MADPTQGWVDITCSDLGAMRLWQRQQWIRQIDNLLAERQRCLRREIRITALKNYVKSCGFCATSVGLLADRELSTLLDFFHRF